MCCWICFFNDYFLNTKELHLFFTKKKKNNNKLKEKFLCYELCGEKSSFFEFGSFISFFLFLFYLFFHLFIFIWFFLCRNSTYRTFTGCITCLSYRQNFTRRKCSHNRLLLVHVRVFCRLIWIFRLESFLSQKRFD